MYIYIYMYIYDISLQFIGVMNQQTEGSTEKKTSETNGQFWETIKRSIASGGPRDFASSRALHVGFPVT